MTPWGEEGLFVTITVITETHHSIKNLPDRDVRLPWRTLSRRLAVVLQEAAVPRGDPQDHRRYCTLVSDSRCTDGIVGRTDTAP